MTEDEYVKRIHNEIKQLQSELSEIRSKGDYQVYQAMSRADIIEQRIETLYDNLENI